MVPVNLGFDGLTMVQIVMMMVKMIEMKIDDDGMRWDGTEKDE